MLDVKSFLAFMHHSSSKLPECQKIIKVGLNQYSMALNTLKCNHLTELGLIGLLDSEVDSM